LRRLRQRRWRELTDERLLQLFDKGRDPAFEELLRRHGSAIKAYALRMLRRPEVAEEVYMETFERVAALRGKRPQRGGSVRSYFFTIAHNRCVDLLRHARRVRESRPQVTELEITRKLQVSPDAEVALGRVAEELEEALATLPEGHRQVLLLRTVHGLSSRETAEIVGLDEGQVRSQLSYARKQIRKMLAVHHAELAGRRQAGPASARIGRRP